MPHTLSSTYPHLVTLSGTADNPVTITSTGVLSNGLVAQTLSSENWTILNSGVIANAGALLESLGTVVNSGTIGGSTAAGGFGIDLQAGGDVTNQSGGTISGYDAVTASGSAASLINSGYIQGLLGAGVLLEHGGTANNQATGTIVGATYGVSISGAASVINQGQITGGTVGVDLSAGGTLTNLGSITSTTNGDAVNFGTGAATLVIDPNAAFSGDVVADASFTNLLELTPGGAGVLNNKNGLSFQGFSTIVVETGATWALVGDFILSNGGVVDDGSLTNLGTITAGVGAGGVYVAAGGSMTNKGTITGGSGKPGEDGGVGVMFANGGTLVDGGSISGGIGTSNTADAVSFGAGASRLVLDPQATLGGIVVADGAFDNVLELASSASIGTLSAGIGTGIEGFQSIVVDTGANWLLNGDNHINSTTTLTGTGNALDISNGSVAVSGGVFDNTGILLVGNGDLGSLQISNDGTVEDGGASIADTDAAAGSSVDLNGTGSNWQVAGSLKVGNASTGVLSINAGATVTATTLDAGEQTGSAGVVTVTGDGTDLTTTGSLSVGDAGSGELSILNGADVSIGGNLDIGNTAGGSGNVDIEDTTGTIVIGANLDIGNGAPGVLTVGPDATVQLDNGGQFVGADATLNLFSPFDAPQFNDNTGTTNIKATQEQTYLAYLTNTGAYVLNAGVTYTLDTPVINGSGGAFSIGASGGELVLNADSITGQTISFSDATGTLLIGIDQLQTIDVPPSGTGPFTSETNPNFGLPVIGGFQGVINDYVVGDQIIVDTTQAATFTLSGSVVSVIENGNPNPIGALTFAGTLQAQTAFDTPGAITDQVRCFAAGTRIQTARGPVAVEALREGDRVVTAADGRLEPIIWIGRRALDCQAHPQPEQVWPVRVTRGAFGPGQPARELWLSPDHAVFVNDVLVPVKCLINGTTIAQVPRRSITYYHIELPRHELLLAEDLAVESYLDVGDRSNFENGGGVMALFPNFTCLKWETEGCAPLVVTGPELEAAKAVVSTWAPPAARAVSKRNAARNSVASAA